MWTVDSLKGFPRSLSSTHPFYSRAPGNRPPAELPVRITEFKHLKHNDDQQMEFACSISTLEGISLCATTLRGTITPQPLDILTKAIKLLRPARNVSTRSSFALFTTRYTRQATDQSDLTTSCSHTSLILRVRILVPNADTLVNTSGLPRGSDFLSYFEADDSTTVDPWSPRDFYDNVHTPDKNGSSDLPPVDELHCALYPFQKRAIRWLLEREGSSEYGVEAVPKTLPHGFLHTHDADGQSCFVSRLLGLATTREELVRTPNRELRGGILAEEMGLGKTVEVISLICLHKRNNSYQHEVTPVSSIAKSKATLIITPPAILQQWKDELRTLAPALDVVTYDGMRVESHKNDDAGIRQKCLNHDIVLTTYPILARDIYYAEAPPRNLRHEKKHEKRLSPLTQIDFWRVVLDEAQILESGISNAAKVASIIPRQLAWCVSGTPARNPKDLFGLLVFLQYKPYCQLPLLWERLVNQHRQILTGMFRDITLRHTKSQIKDDLQLPRQKRIVITVPFTTIEEQHYSSLFQQMAEDCGLETDGGPLREDWDPEDPRVIEKMRSWLVRLRQTCLHPEVGRRNRQAFGNSKGPLRTVAEVLEVMIEQNDTMTRTEERNLLLSQIRRGQIHEHAEQSQTALDIWVATLDETRVVVQECRRQLQLELDKFNAIGVDANFEGDAEAVAMTRTGIHKQRLRAALEVEHICVFFVANAYYQLKTKELSLAENVDHAGQMPMSEVAKDFEGKEEAFYEMAKALRRELLMDSQQKADTLINKVKAKSNSLVHVPAIAPVKDQGGLQVRPVFDRTESLLAAMQSQTTQLLAWRSKAVKLLTLPLVDQEDTELQGDEYETSTKQQDEVYVYVDALSAIVSDRHDALTGQENHLIDRDMKNLLKEAKEGKGHSPQLLLLLLKRRQELKPTKDLGSIRALITELRELKQNLRSSVEKYNARAAAESIIVNSLLHNLHQISIEQTKVVSALDKEVELFKDTMNLRLDYYRQLQAISDTVAPFEDEMSDDVREGILFNKEQAESHMKARIATLKSKGRYLVHLRDEAMDTQSQRTCIICTSPFENGILTSCGHTYCAECLRLWWGQHRNCPSCKRHLSRNDFHQITYKPKDLTLEEEEAPIADKAVFPANDTTSSIYSGVRVAILNQIKDIDLDGSFGTKIDTLGRHLLWIREHDPGAKSIIFSQYRDFLDVLTRAFSQFKICFTGIDAKDGIQKFKNDPSIECFFLHAKAHSSGLNLVNATHVFLCEPLINTAIELQAIARVHRIGQHHETTVWMYLVEGTVEKSIYDISVQRRLAHVGQLKGGDNGDGQEEEPMESQLEAANTLELEQTPLSHLLTKGSSGGELVQKEDLWDCLFSSRLGQNGMVSLEAQATITDQLGVATADAH